MVLTDDNYASIVAAVEQGRIIYANIRKFVFFLLSSNVAEIMIIFLATLAGLPPPLTAIQLLWLNLITDGAPALALAMEKGDPDIMARKPRAKSEPIINRTMRHRDHRPDVRADRRGADWPSRWGCSGICEAGDALPAGMNPLAYLLQYDWRGVDVQTAETMAFVTLSLCELFRAYTVRSEFASHLPHRRVLEPLHAVGRAGLDHPAAAGVHRALPAADLQHALPGGQGVGPGARPGPGSVAVVHRWGSRTL